MTSGSTHFDFGGVFFISFLLIHSFMSFTKYWGKRQEWAIKETGIAPWKEEDGEEWVGFSVQFSHSVMSDSLQPHGLQHARPPCPSSIPGACSNSRPSSQWCHPTISSSVVPFSSHPQLFPASGSFQVSSLHQVAKVLEFQLQHQPFQWILRIDFL